MTTLKPFDLRPDPRILPMLGEINLAQWRCIAEIIDNSVDGFLASSRRGRTVDQAQVIVNLPTTDLPSARVTVRDNGPGMDAEVLEKAVRAGWSGNTPVDSLGLFGMGFNIATARLGVVTSVWTTTAGDPLWHGLRIDFAELGRQKHFLTPHLTRPKSGELDEHGTEVTVEQLKPDMRAWLVKPANQSQIRERLSEAYGAMLRASGVPISFELSVNNRRINAKNHCTWDESRAVETSKWGRVQAVISIDKKLPDRPYCIDCWNWLVAGASQCPACESSASVVLRKRHVHGWVGLQRYLSPKDFGIDFIRNGRKIEIANKEVFDWVTDDGGEKEYPIDDPRNRGRFVGEIHLDHARVTYTKDRFERTDPAWDEMLGIVRGEGPLRPEKAAEAGFGRNESPLFRLYQAFRRSSPPRGKLAGGWAQALLVQDNDRALEMAGLFHKGQPEYQSDDKWWQLVEEQDRNLLTGTTGSPGRPAPGAATPLPGFTGGVTAPGANTTAASSPPPVVAPLRTPLLSLTRQYHEEVTGLRWDVRAFSAQPIDPLLRQKGLPWKVTRRPTGEWEFVVDPSHDVFKSATLTELDALLWQLAWIATDSTRGRADAPEFAEIVARLRDAYAGPMKLDPAALKGQAELVFAEIAKLWARSIPPEDHVALFEDDLTAREQEEIYTRMATRSVANPKDTVRRGRYLEYASPSTVVRFAIAHPELFFDGRCWDDAYATLEFPVEAATTAAKARILRQYESLLADARWLADQDPDDIAGAARARVLRASLALDLLTPLDRPIE